MESLLASFRREKAKGKRSVGTGKARQEIYESKWFAFPRLAFLLDRDEPRATVDSVQGEDNANIECECEESQNEDAATNSQEEDIGETLTQITETPMQTSQITTNTSQSVVATPSVTQRRKRKLPPETLENTKVDEALSILKNAVANKDNSCSVYGQHVANKLRSYTNKTRNIVQHHINNILFNADMGHYDIELRPNSQSNFSPLISPRQTPVPTPSPQFDTTSPYLSSDSQTPTPSSSPRPHTTVSSAVPFTYSHQIDALLQQSQQSPNFQEW